MQMTVSQGVRAEILALGRKVTMALALGHYSVMEIETFSASTSQKGDSAAKAEKHSCCWASVPSTETSCSSKYLFIELHREPSVVFSPSPALEKSCIKCRFSIPIFWAPIVTVVMTNLPQNTSWLRDMVVKFGNWWSLKCLKIITPLKIENWITGLIIWVKSLNQPSGLKNKVEGGVCLIIAELSVKENHI